MLRREPDRFTKAYHLVLTALLLHILGQTRSFVHAHSSYHATATYNVKGYGATGAAHNVTDGVMYAGSRQLTSATATFSSADVGSPIYVLGASTANISGIGIVPGAPLNTTTAAVAGLHTVILEDTARSSVSHASVTWGPDDTSALLDLAGSSGGGTVYFPTGLYRVSGQPALNINYSLPLWAMLVIRAVTCTT
jgi:hypothetical protein